MTPTQIWACMAMVLTLATGVAAAEASEPETLRIANLRVEGGAENWHADDVFQLGWDQAPGATGATAAVVYRLYDSDGNPFGGEIRNREVTWAVEQLKVPLVPGPYTAEVWLEDQEGHAGPHASTTLLFDNQAPSPPQPQAPPTWLAAGAKAQLKIGHPIAPLPLSGIRGYAISLDREAPSSPCAKPNRCTPAEIDLDGGAGDDVFLPGNLLEGTTFATVAAVSGSGVPSATRTVEFRVDATPPVVSLSGPPAGWSRGPVKLTAVAADALSGMTAAGPSGPFTAVAVDGGPTSQSPGNSVSAWVGGSGVHSVSYFGRDAAGNVNDGQLSAPEPATATVRIDEEPPRVAFANQDADEPERIEAAVTDRLSGASDNRGSISLRPAESGLQYEELPTRVAGNRLVANWDSDSYPTGRYEFLATAYDAAGNVASSAQRSSGGKLILPNPLKTRAWIGAGFGQRPMTEWTVRYGRSIAFGGRLYAYGGAPAGGQVVTITESFAPGSTIPSRTSSAVTRADGSFSLRLAPGPSREVTASFGGTRLLTRASGQGAHLKVLTSAHLHASATAATVGGPPIVFSGKVAETGAERSAKGLPVELQFRYPGAGWSEFRTVTADRRGRFRYAYRFSDDDSRGVRFQFRAFVAGGEGWPYEPSASRPVIVTGR
jgi:hypothetical protein